MFDNKKKIEEDFLLNIKSMAFVLHSCLAIKGPTGFTEKYYDDLVAACEKLWELKELQEKSFYWMPQRLHKALKCLIDSFCKYGFLCESSKMDAVVIINYIKQ